MCRRMPNYFHIKNVKNKYMPFVKSVLKLLVLGISLVLLIVLVIFNYNRLLHYMPIPRSAKQYIIVGQDRKFVMKRHEEHMNYPIVKFTFERPHENAYKFVIGSLRRVIDEPYSKFRINMDRLHKYLYHYSTESTNTIILYTFEQVDTIQNVDKSLVAYKAAANPNKLKFIIANDGLMVCASHLIHDGVSLFNILTTFTNIPKLKLNSFNYIPVVNEALMAKSVWLSLEHIHDTLAIQRQFKHLISWNTGCADSTLVKTKVNIAQVKTIKRAIKQRNMELPFPMVFAAVQLLGIFYASKVDKLSVGVTVGFDNNSKFNNFTVIPIMVDKPFTELNRDTYTESIMTLLTSMHSTLQKTSHLLHSIYSITNVYNFDTYLNDNFDVLLSGIPMCTKKQYHFDGIDINTVSGTMPCHTSPIYILFLSDMYHAFTTQHIRTNEINVEQLKQYNEYLSDWLA